MEIKRSQLKELIRGIILEAIQNEIFGFGKPSQPNYTPQQKSTVELLMSRGFKVEGVIRKDGRTVVRLSRPYGKGRHGGPRYAYVYTDGTINEKIPVDQYLRIVGESMTKPQDPRFKTGTEIPMGAVNVEEGWAQGEYTPVQQQAITVLQKLGFKEVGSFANQPDADGGGMDDKVTVVLQKKQGPIRLSVEVDADGTCNGKSVQEFIRSGGTTEEQTGTGAVAGFQTPFAFKKNKEENIDEVIGGKGFKLDPNQPVKTAVGNFKLDALRKIAGKYGKNKGSKLYTFYYTGVVLPGLYQEAAALSIDPRVRKEDVPFIKAISSAAYDKIHGAEISEMTSTGAVAGYQTPFAFSKKKSGSKRALDVTTRMGFKKVKDISEEVK